MSERASDLMSCGKSVFIILSEQFPLFYQRVIGQHQWAQASRRGIGGPQVCYRYLVEAVILNKGPNTRTKW
ncbi:hypothetical protein DPMN_140727 [Dreissena polymorpha]|uniref:Uncharacterized protein n=1 Tax=Dreissena polymorpha TaxID=45954 RepID=A0A9D4JJ96_DREPO|nr:hypothetical protein DPMN_140727 [Dreissena polymorpha]